MTDEEYEELKEAQTVRFLDLLKAMGVTEGAWDGIIDWVLDGVSHPDARLTTP